MVNLMKKYKDYTKVGKELGISDNAVKKKDLEIKAIPIILKNC